MKAHEIARRDDKLQDLLYQHKGKDNMVTTEEIKMFLKLNGYSCTSNQNAAQRVTILAKNRELPIVAAQCKGYFWANTPEEIQEYINYLETKAQGLLESVDRYKKFLK